MNMYLQVCRGLQDYHLVMWFNESIIVSLLIWLAHYISVFLTIGSMVMMDLRVLGVAGRNQSASDIADFYAPWMWIGLAVLFVTGMLMLAGDSVLFCTNGVFGINMLITIVAAASGVLVRKMAPAWDRPSGTPLGAKLVAAVSILLWLGTILSALEVPAISGVP
jgi:hypothetical protein